MVHFAELRTAIESGLRERLAEEMARKENINVSKLPKATWKKIKELSSSSNVDGDTLYHYTTQNGLIGIIKSGYFRATHFHFFEFSA